MTDAEQICRLLEEVQQATAERDEARAELVSVRKGYDTTYDAYANEETENARLREHIDWMRQTVHRVHHDQPMETCKKSTCQGSRRALAGEEGK